MVGCAAAVPFAEHAVVVHAVAVLLAVVHAVVALPFELADFSFAELVVAGPAVGYVEHARVVAAEQHYYGQLVVFWQLVEWHCSLRPAVSLQLADLRGYGQPVVSLQPVC